MSSRNAGIERIAVVGFNHRQLPAHLRGRLAFDDEWCERMAGQLRSSKLADGVAFVSTCNRQEILVSAEHAGFASELVRAQLHSMLVENTDGPPPEPYRFAGEDAVRHVLRVASSLDSLVVGEREITQQLRRSFDRARRHGWLDKPLNGLIRVAVETAKEVHRRTRLGEERIGVFSLAAELVLKETAGIERPRVVVAGLGEIGLKTARALVPHRRLDLMLTSRRPREAGELGTLLEQATFVPLESLKETVREADALVVATGASRPVVDERLLHVLEGKRRLVVVDIGIPPQVNPSVRDIGGVELFNLDWFTATGFGQRPHQREAIQSAQQIIESGVRRAVEWVAVRRYSHLFDSCVNLSERYKAEVLPELLRAELSVLPPDQQKLVFGSVHRLLTSYTENLFETLNRELNDHVDLADADPPDPGQSRQ